MNFDTRDFEFSHGRKPGGEGRWAFSTHRHPTPEQIFWHQGPYREAKAVARSHFQPTKGGPYTVVYVLP